MGLFMGDDLTEPNYEDWYLSRALRSGNREEIKNVISSYNDISDPVGWAFKRPSLNHLVFNQISLFRNPVILLVKKDICSIARRRAELRGQSQYASFLYVYLTYHWLRWKAMCSGVPVIVVEYATVIKYPSHWIEQFCQLFSKVPLNQEAALLFIKKGNDNYLKWKESSKQWMQTPFRGAVDIISSHRLAGWARHNKNNEPVLVEVRVNGKALVSSRAMVYREDVYRRLHGCNGYCGFDFSFDTPLSDTELSNVEVCVEGVLFLDCSKTSAIQVGLNSKDSDA